MEQAIQAGTPIPETTTSSDLHNLVVDAKDIDNAVLRRLIGEVQSEKENHLHAYNRQHNRHNRGR